MRLLIVKLSSLGDVIHLLPALTDLTRARTGVEVDWLIEPAFAEIAAWHPAVREVLPVALRAVRRAPHQWIQRIRALRGNLAGRHYDLVVDAQGLIKSALLARLAGRRTVGLAAPREALARHLYARRCVMPDPLHVIERGRRLLACALDYATPNEPPDFGIAASCRALPLPGALAPFSASPFAIGLHGTTWSSKLWPETHWATLARGLAERGLTLLLPQGSDAEATRAARIQAASDGAATPLPRLTLAELTALLTRARLHVSVETGLAHLAAALGVPGLVLHGPTSPAYSGVLLPGQIHLESGLDCAPCFRRRCPLPLDAQGRVRCQGALTPERVLETLSATT
jgi:heptosyltransferase-1